MFSLKSFNSFFILILLIFTATGKSYSQSKLRIGTHDSRVIAVAYYNSNYFKLPSEVNQRMKTAKEKNDTIEIANIDKEMNLRQRMMHEQGFGKGSVSYIMDEIKDKMSELAKNEGLNIIVSKWELNFNSTDGEIIDISEKVANLFEPTKDMRDMYQEFLKNEPVKDAFLIED